MKIRVRFKKTGAMKFIGHLDVMHFFQQLLRRSDIPVAYSSGMSPHQIMSFALPLSIGAESIGEYMDIEITRPVASLAAIESINNNSAKGMEIVSFRELPEKSINAMASVKASDYLISFREGYDPDFDLTNAIEKMFEKDDITVTKKTKRSEKELDIKPLIFDHCIMDSPEIFKNYGLKRGQSIFLKLSSGSVDNIKPELVMGALYSSLNKELSEMSLLITRLDMFTETDIGLISLDDIGKNI